MKIFSDIYKIWNSASVHQKRIVHVVLLLLIGTAVYANSLNVPFVLDDHYSIEFLGKKNLLEHLLHGSLRRVADLTLTLNYRVHGLQVAGYHLTNLAIHLTTSILLYFIMVSTLSALRVSFAAQENVLEDAGKEWRPVEQWLPFAVALLFVSHPVQTQAVTYIIQRYTTLATLFYLLSTLFFIRARLALEKSGPCLKSWLLGGSALVAGLLAVGSKQIAVTLPFMLLLLELFLFRGRLINRRFFGLCGAFFIIIVAAVLYAWHGSSLDDFLFDLRHATSEDLFTTRTTYFLTQTRVVVTYLRLLCLPYGQNLVHDSPLYTTLFSAPVAASLALHIFLLATAAVLFRWSGQNLLAGDRFRGVFQRLASLGIFWFYGAMAVESSVLPIRDVIFEHRIYLPSVGFFMTVASVAALAVQGRRPGMKAAWSLLVAVCIILGSLTIARNQVWNDSLSLWEDAARKSPNKWLALSNLAGQYMDKKMPEKALPLYVRAIELNPNLFIISKVCLGDALKALNLYGSRFTTGQEYILPGGVLGSGNLDYKNLSKWDSLISNNMGLAYEYLKEPEKAKKAYRVAVSLNPAYDLAWFNLSLLAYRLGDKREAEAALWQLQMLNQSMARDLSAIINPAVSR